MTQNPFPPPSDDSGRPRQSGPQSPAPHRRPQQGPGQGSGPAPGRGPIQHPNQHQSAGHGQGHTQGQQHGPGLGPRQGPSPDEGPGAPTRIVSPEGERVRERPAGAVSGYFAIIGAVALLVVAALLGLVGFALLIGQGAIGAVLLVLGALAFIASMFLFKGCTSVAPGQAVALQLYGKYVGTVRQSGLRFVNPLYSKHQVSTRIRNHETSTLKVNDLDGNPIEIGAVVVWQVRDTAQALFEVDDFEEFVAIQAETAVRHIANSYAYDSSDPTRMSLRDNAEEITEKLSTEVGARVAAAGVTIIESRITQLAYAPEIARAMLQRQQATAVVAARQLIVEGAVGMVETAIEQIERRDIVSLGHAERSDLVTNLMIVLCGDQAAQPTISTTRNKQSGS